MVVKAEGNKGKLKAYFKGVRSELKKVIWPTRAELLNYTAVVTVLSAVVSIVVYVLDLGIHGVLKIFI
ncbi:MAG: preprotein translocase subunit SecE [Tissierellia bacterium]|jgi:preprotein translocase subunit SecE|nr:preprotein translocase subunit SecE [Tissierellia bacterium]